MKRALLSRSTFVFFIDTLFVKNKVIYISIHLYYTNSGVATTANDRSCPACDAKINDNDTICSQCGIVLTIFDADINKIGLPGKESESYLTDLLNNIETVDEGSENSLLEDIKMIGKSLPVTIEQFPCPSCGELLPVSAKSCTKCNAQFVEEGATQFQCPICSTMVDANATTCPGCGAEFAETAEEEKKDEQIQEKTKKSDEIKESTEKENIKTEPEPKGDKKVRKKKKEDATSWTRFIKRKK